jgi:hypothetical protein
VRGLLIALTVLVVFAVLAWIRWALQLLFQRELESRLNAPPPPPPLEDAQKPPAPGTKVRVRHPTPFHERTIDLHGPPCRARVRYWMRDRKKRGDAVHYTEFAAELPAAPRRLRVATKGWAAGSGDFGRPHSTGDAVFDGVYDVATTYPGWAEAFLDGEIRECILNLDRMHAGPFLLDVRGSQLVVRVTGELESVTDLDPFIKDCYRLCERALGTPGVESAEVTASGGVCPVCDAGLEGPSSAPLVSCSKCRTRHHRECWDYNDGCAIFACGCRSYSP